MKKAIFFLITGVLAALSSPLMGEDLTLEQVRELALANSVSLARYNLSARTNQLTEQNRIYSLMPSLSLGMSASMNLWGEPALVDSLNAGASISLSQKLWDGGKSGVQKAINALTNGITRQEALAEYYTVLDSADSAYYGVLEAQASLATAEASLESALLALSIAEVRLANRAVSYGDYLQALAEKEAKESSRNQAKRDLSLNILKLRRLTGLSEITGVAEIDFEIGEDLIQRFASLGDEGIGTLYTQLWQKVLSANPTLAKSALSGQKADQAVALAAKDYMPSLNAGLSTGLSYSFAAGKMDVNSGRLNLSLNIPLDFWVTALSVEKQTISRQEAALEYRNTETSLMVELQSAILDCVAQAETVRSSRRAYEYAQQHYEHVRELYSLSQGSLSSYSDAAAMMSSNRNQYTRARFSFLKGLSKLRSLGGFDSDEALYTLLRQNIAV